MINWLRSPSHTDWLAKQATDLLTFARACGVEGGGAAWLDDHGQPDPAQPLHTWITARMTHIFGLGALMGIPGTAPVAEVAMAGLTGPLRDAMHGGWYSSVGSGTPAEGKSCYAHAFVLLAATTAVHAGLDGATDLFEEASSTFLDRFWDDEAGACFDTWDTTFSNLDTYRGINANMHAVEAMMSAAGLTGDGAWLTRAERVCRLMIAAAKANDWRIPEHYDDSWKPMLDFNREQPADQFKPYGATVGHAFEWSRLLVHLAHSPVETDRRSIIDAAEQLFDRAVKDGWAPDGAPGFVYTTDWDGTPVVRDRLHWVLTEAISAAAVLHHHTGIQQYADLYRAWWDHAATFHIDPDGSWKHQLDERNQPAATVWRGKPDIYHAFQTALAPTLPMYPMLAAALDQRR